MRYKIKGKTYFLINILLIFFLSLLLYIAYIKNISNKLIEYSDIYYEKYLYQKLNKNILELIPKSIDGQILKLFQNNNGDILYVDYDLEKVYSLLNKVSTSLNNDEDYHNISIKIPFLGMSDNVFYNNIGPKIQIGINIVDANLININTKVTSYGLNNALLEVYLNASIVSQIISPGKSIKKSYEYSFLIASKVINGRVPSFYGNSMISSRIINVPIKI